MSQSPLVMDGLAAVAFFVRGSCAKNTPCFHIHCDVWLMPPTLSTMVCVCQWSHTCEYRILLGVFALCGLAARGKGSLQIMVGRSVLWDLPFVHNMASGMRRLPCILPSLHHWVSHFLGLPL